jgi:hypothetical protein
MLRVPRSRGALTGVLLVLLGAWGGLIPFVGPSFGYAYTPDAAWTYTAGRLWLEILPGAAATLGGIILLATSVRPVALAGAALSALAGAWFAVGTVLSPLWATAGTGTAGVPVGGTFARAMEQAGFFTGLGVVIVFVAALAAGRLSAVTVRDSVSAERRAAALAETPAAGGDRAVPSPRQPA